MQVHDKADLSSTTHYEKVILAASTRLKGSCCILDAAFWMLHFGCCILDAAFWMLHHN
jgi:hypothetical protein